VNRRLFKERVKSSAIIILIINLIFLTVHLWFVNSTSELGESVLKYVREIPVVERFFPIEPKYSISKENLSMPRKFLINDGSLWMAYYNTDIGFAPIEERTRQLITAFLSGDVTASRKIDHATWEAGLESLSIYVEYPVAFSSEMFCRIMGVDSTNIPEGLDTLREFIIIPSSEESDICILARDSSNGEDIYAYILNSRYILPAADLSVYTNNDDGYYQPAFSTGLELDEKSNVTLAPLVLFSDSQPVTEVLQPHNLINDNSKGKLLENFEFNAEMTPYEDTQGGVNYIANYGSATLFPDSLFEYTAVSDDRGILLDESGDSYSVLNASIDFAEKTWACVSDEPLSILVTSDLSDYDSSKAYTFKFDYYCNGRPVEVDLESAYGHDKINCAIEITVKGGRLISYRQYMRLYQTVAQYNLSDTFVTALDNFVQVIDEDAQSPVRIDDIYIGYLDSGDNGNIYAAWLAKTNDGKIYRYLHQTEVTQE
jgi:hypothetical protein